MKLEVEKYYKNRGGEVVKIVKYEHQEGTVYPYSDNEGETYQENGQYCRSLPGDDLDLIEEVVPVPAYRVKVEQTDMRDFQPWMEGEKGKVYTEFKLLKDSEKLVRLESYTYYATQVDAGYIDPITGEFVMNENESKKLKLEVGKTYKTRGGETVKIVEMIPYERCSFISEEFVSYTKDGLRYDWIPDHDLNLIEEVIMTPKKPKFKLEVGKTYRDGNGELHRIVNNKPNSCYPEHVYWSDGRSYTIEGFWQMDKEPHKYNLIEEVEEETNSKTKKEQPKMKYYRTTKKNTETNIPVGTVLILDYDNGTNQPRYKAVNTEETRYLVTDRLEEINVKTVKTVISPASKLVKILEDSGYVMNEDGSWDKPDEAIFFNTDMLYFCGKEPDEDYTWLPEWLEEKVVFDSVVNTFNARQFIVDFMKKKRELSHEAYLYQRDIDEIENEWSDKECEKVAGVILSRKELGFGGTSCPFCVKFSGHCVNCSYGKRHGVCSDHDSDFHKHIRPVAYNRAWPELLDFFNNYPGARK